MAVIKTNGGYNALPISYKRGNPIVSIILQKQLKKQFL